LSKRKEIRDSTALTEKKFNTMTTQQISVKIQLKTGFDENLTNQLSIDFGSKKVFGCPIRVKTMKDIE